MYDSKISIGIIGYGVIGKTLADWIMRNNSNCNILISDKDKGFNDNISTCDIFFINIHIDTEKDGTQNLNVLKTIIKQLPQKPIFIRTTILPGTADMLSKEFSRKIYFMPEFLSEKTAEQDFYSKPMIFCGEFELLKSIFVNKQYIIMSNLEAEIAKYAHNVFGALKVIYFNGIYELAKRTNSDYEKIKNGVLLSGYINDTHTRVPGNNNELGYGGKCFPKDVKAFIRYTKGSKFNKLVLLIERLNKFFRNKNER